MQLPVVSGTRPKRTRGLQAMATCSFLVRGEPQLELMDEGSGIAAPVVDFLSNTPIIPRAEGHRVCDRLALEALSSRSQD